MVLLQCVDDREAEQMQVEVHEGSFGTHANGHAMARKILRARYYWLTVENDYCIHVRKCHKCQTFERLGSTLAILYVGYRRGWSY